MKVSAIVRYTLATIAQLAFTALAMFPPVTFAVAACCGSDGYLPRWLAWFQTQDAPLDAGWRDGYFATDGTPTGLALWWLRVRWLWRNPAYGVCYWPLGRAYDPSEWVIDAIEHDGAGVTLLRAHTQDGRAFAFATSNGWKLGYKLWWALDADFQLVPAPLPATRGPDNRLPLCFTPGRP